MKEKRSIKEFIFPLIMCFITALIGCVFIWLSKESSLNLKIEIIVIGFIPTLLFVLLFLIGYLKCNTKKSQAVITAISGFLTINLFFYYMVAIFACLFVEFFNPVTDIIYYKDKVKGNLLEVFPKDIPSDVEKVKFVYSPGVLQAATQISLYYVDREMTFEKFDKKYKSSAEWIGHKNDYTEKEGLFGNAFSETPAYYTNEDDYVIYLADSKCDNSGYCNHGHYLFASYNEETNEVIYKYAEW